MTLSTATLRNVYAPACRPKGSLYDTAYSALDACLSHHGYRPRTGVTGAYNCRKITGGSGYSLHAYGSGNVFTFWNGVRCATSLAVDINWDKNPYGPRLVTDMPRAMIDSIYRVRTNSGAQVWGWGGYYRGNKDAMHFEIVCWPADLRSGINSRTLPGINPTPTPKPAPVPAPTKKKGFPMEAALELVKIHYDNARGDGKGSYDVAKRDRAGYQHWVTTLLDAYDKGKPLKPIVDNLGGQLYLEMLSRK